MRGPYYWLIGSLMEPEDDFCQRLRKACSALFFIPGSLFTFFYCMKSIIDGISAAQAPILGFIGQVTMTLIIWGQYAFLRKTKHVGGVQAGLLPWSAQVLNLTLSLNKPEFDQNSLVFMLALLSVLLQIPKLAIFLVFSGIIALVQHWNHSHFHDAPGSMLILPQGHHNGGPNPVYATPTDLFIFGTLTVLLLAAVIYNFILQVQESERLGAAQKAANEMTLKILRCQRHYDTEGISEILVESRQEDVVDPKLIGLYETMNSNLQSYRPFLPNYLFQNEDEEFEGGGDGDDDEGAISAQNESEEVASACVDGQSSRSGTDPTTRRTRGGDDSSTANSRRGGSIAPAKLQLNAREALFNGRVTFALIDINADRLTNAVELGGAAITRFLKIVVHMIYSLAKETKASVHSMLGDTVQLTWNATSNVALPETKGAVFLCRLAKLFEQPGGEGKNALVGTDDNGDAAAPSSTRPSLTLCAAICSGKATVHSITSDQQQALIVEAPWLPALEGCFDLAKVVGHLEDKNGGGGRGCLLMDERTMKGSQLEVQSCPVESVSYHENQRATFLGEYNNRSSHLHLQGIINKAIGDDEGGGHQGPASASSVVHLLLQEHTRAEDEWMYQLQGPTIAEENLQQESGGGGLGNLSLSALRIKALQLCAEGQYSEAQAHLQKIEERAAAAQDTHPGEAELGDATRTSKKTAVFIHALLERCQHEKKKKE